MAITKESDLGQHCQWVRKKENTLTHSLKTHINDIQARKRWPSREVRKGHRIQNKSKDTGFFRNQEKIYKRYCPESNAAVKSITIRTAKNTWFRIKEITGDLIKNYLVGLVKVEAEFCGGKEQMEGKKLRKQVFLERKGKTRTKSEARDREAAEKECGSKGIQTRFCTYKW